MRMWNVPVEMLCAKHLRGEHVECHMFVGCIERGNSISGFVADKLVDTTLIKERHDALAQEMLDRGGNHNSPLEQPTVKAQGEIDVQANIRELARRCPDCRVRIAKNKHKYKELVFISDIPLGGDKVFEERDGVWRAQHSGTVLAEEFHTRNNALNALEKRRKRGHIK